MQTNAANSPNFDKLIFHHLTKTAGTSLINELKNNGLKSFDNARYDFEWSNEAFISEDYNFFHGHFTFDKVAEIVGVSEKKVLTFTFLRNPIDRVISQFYNWKNLKKTAAEAEVIASRNNDQKFLEDNSSFEREIAAMTLEDFLLSDHPKILDSKYNHQTRYLANSESRNSQIETAFHNAKFNVLNFYDFVGIKEAYNTSCRLLERKLNIPTKSLNSDNHININSKKSFKEKYQVTKKEYELLLANNQYDIRLFEFAVAGFITSNKLHSKPNIENLLKGLDSGHKVKI